MSSLTGKVALITGSSKGIGAAIARNLSARGAAVVINYANSLPDAEATFSSLTGTNHHIIRADVSKVSECQRLVAETIDKYSRLDIVVLNAGWMPNLDFAAITEADFDKCYNLNVKGPLFIAQAAAKHLPEDGSGRIIFFSTSLTVAPVLPIHALYISTKGAVEQLVRGLNKDLARRNIAVNAVSPGPTATELFLLGKSEQVVNTIKSTIPRGRLGEPEDIAEVVGFLSSKEAGWVMGQTLRANGGFV